MTLINILEVQYNNIKYKKPIGPVSYYLNKLINLNKLL